jgi:phosphoribosylformimino-5-aminoimidazole carboxamide ribotide isomerase
MTKFRPCIDLHEGKVKQIVGGTLRDQGPGPQENYVSANPASWYAAKYRQDQLTGGHIIKLGPGNDQVARQALAAYPGGMQIGGAITSDNAISWIDAGASHVIVTSWLFASDGRLIAERLDELVQRVGKERIVLDLSCRRCTDSDGQVGWRVAMNRWQTLTEIEVTPKNLDMLAASASEFLIHAADVEGLCRGIDEPLVELMGAWAKIPMTYAGGVAALDDVQRVKDASQDRVDVTVGSALDLFGGSGVRYDDLVRWNQS